jgi:NADPH2:quinone reductase
MRALAWGGRFLVCGFASGGSNPKTGIPKIPLNLALLNERAILGVFWGAWRARDDNVGNRRNMMAMLKMVQEGKLSPTISRVYPLEQTVDACADLMGRKVVGKVCISPSAARL